MRAGGLRALVAVIVALVIALALWMQRPASKPTAIEPVSAPAPIESGTRELAAVPAPRASATAARVAEVEEPTVSLAEDGAHAPGQFEFDVIFAPVDELGRALAGVRVEFALEGHRANCMGYSNAEGELHRRWRGDLATIRGTVSAVDERGTSCTNDVVLTADGLVRLRFRAENFAKILNAYSSKVAQYPPTGQPNLRMRDMLYIAPAFETDAAGNGLFTDPDLIAISDPDSKPYETEAARRTFSMPTDRRSSGRPGIARIDAFVHDPNGKPIALLAPWRTFGGRGFDGRKATTDRDGRFTKFTQSLGPVELEVGGGIFTTQRKKFDLEEDGSVQSWDVELSELPTVRGRLVVEDGKGLGSWHVQAREDHPPFGFLQACETDGGGNFRIGLSGNESIRLLVNSSDDIERPAILLSEHQTATADRVDFALSDAKPAKEFAWQIEMPATAMGRLPEARIVQHNSLEGIVLTPCDAGRSLSGGWTWSFRIERALVGSYSITCSVPGGSSTFDVHVLSGSIAFGPQLPPGIVRIGLPDRVVEPEDKLTIRALATAQGVRVRSETLPFPGSYFVPEGDVELWIVGTTSQGKHVKLRRNVSGQDGERVMLVLDGLHPPAESRATGAAQR